MSFLTDLLSTVFERRYLGFSIDQDDDRPIETLTEELIGATGEVSGQTVARRTLDRFERVDDEARLGFSRHLALETTISPDALRETLDAYEQGQTKASYRAFVAAAEPP